MQKNCDWELINKVGIFHSVYCKFMKLNFNAVTLAYIRPSCNDADHIFPVWTKNTVTKNTAVIYSKCCKTSSNRNVILPFQVTRNCKVWKQQRTGLPATNETVISIIGIKSTLVQNSGNSYISQLTRPVPVLTTSLGEIQSFPP